MKITDKIEITNEDNMELMKRYPDNYFDLVITDPPYNVKYSYNEYSDDMTYEDYKEWCKSWFNELERITEGAIFISCGLVNIGLWYEIKKPNWVIAWLKPASMGRSSVGFCNWEPVLFYGKVGKQNVDVFKAPIKPDKSMDFHSCPKPVKWAEEILYKYAKEGSKVLDIFSGSGTTAIACHNLGFELTACELDKDYYEASIKRIKNHIAQQRLF